MKGVADNKWLVDSGSSQHLTRDNSLFETLKMFRERGKLLG